jgi:hypothetical protein
MMSRMLGASVCAAPHAVDSPVATLRCQKDEDGGCRAETLEKGFDVMSRY